MISLDSGVSARFQRGHAAAVTAAVTADGVRGKLLSRETHHSGAQRYHRGVAMTLRLPADLDAELRVAAEEDHRSVQQQVVHAIETYLAQRETLEVKSDPDTLRALAEARAASRAGDVVYGTDAVHALVEGRRAS